MPPMGTGSTTTASSTTPTIAYYRRRAAGRRRDDHRRGALVVPDAHGLGAEDLLHRAHTCPGCGALVDALQPVRRPDRRPAAAPRAARLCSGGRVAPSAVPLSNSAAPVPHELTRAADRRDRRAVRRCGRARAGGRLRLRRDPRRARLPAVATSSRRSRTGGPTSTAARSRTARASRSRSCARSATAAATDSRSSTASAARRRCPAGSTIEDAEVVAGLLEAAGVACISVSAGQLARAGGDARRRCSCRAGTWSQLAARIKQAVSVPVIAVGRLDDPGSRRAGARRRRAPT